MPAENTIPAIKAAKKPGRSSRKLLSLLLLFFITLLVILFFQSSMSKISEIRISGNELVSKEEIGKAAGIAPGDHFFTAQTGKIRKQVESLRIVESAEVSKTFPGLITIQIKEYQRVAFQLASDGTKEVLLADGTALPVLGSAGNLPFDMPVLSGWSNDDPLKAKLCAALAAIHPRLLSDISEIKPASSAAYPDKIKLYTRSMFEVYTTIDYLSGNIEYLGYITNELKDEGKNSGTITMLEQVRYAPFDSDKQGAEAKDLTDGQENKDMKETKSPKQPTPKPKETPKPPGRG